MYNNIINHEIESRITPETTQERAIIQHPEWQEGAMWGKPRYGHPEGKILYHIEEVLQNVEAIQPEAATRQALRFITLTHDNFKHKEHRGFPRDWSRHHAILARHFSEQFTDNQAILDVIELHDEAYYIWKMKCRIIRKSAVQQRLDKLLLRLGNNLQLFYLFFKCDTQTGDKNQKSIEWFEATVKDIDIVVF